MTFRTIRMSETKNAPPRVGRWYRVGGTVMQCGGTDVSDVPARHVFLADDGADVKIAVSEWPSQRVEQLGTTGQGGFPPKEWVTGKPRT